MFLLVLFSAITITTVVLNAIGSSYISGGKLYLDEKHEYIELIRRMPEEVVFYGTHQCITGGSQPLISETWILGTVLEVVFLVLAIWIVVKHFRELRRSLTRWATEDCFRVLIETHVLYFVG
jgi:hypothetical protein